MCLGQIKEPLTSAQNLKILELAGKIAAAELLIGSSASQFWEELATLNEKIRDVYCKITVAELVIDYFHAHPEELSSSKNTKILELAYKIKKDQLEKDGCPEEHLAQLEKNMKISGDALIENISSEQAGTALKQALLECLPNLNKEEVEEYYGF